MAGMLQNSSFSLQATKTEKDIKNKLLQGLTRQIRQINKDMCFGVHMLW